MYMYVVTTPHNWACVVSKGSSFLHFCREVWLVLQFHLNLWQLFVLCEQQSLILSYFPLVSLLTICPIIPNEEISKTKQTKTTKKFSDWKQVGRWNPKIKSNKMGRTLRFFHNILTFCQLCTMQNSLATCKLLACKYEWLVREIIMI